MIVIVLNENVDAKQYLDNNLYVYNLLSYNQLIAY